MSDPAAGAPCPRPSDRRRRHLRRVALVLGGLLLVLVLLLGGCLAWLVATPAGLQFALNQARPWLPDGSRIESAEGRLMGPLALNGVELATADATLAIERIELDWRPSALFGATVQIERLALERARIELAAPEAPAANPGADPALTAPPDDLGPPLALAIEAFSLAPLTITTADGARYRIDRLEFAARADGEALALESLRLQAPAGRAEADLQVGAAAPHPVTGRIDWDLAAIGPLSALAGHGRFGGTLAALRIQHELTAPSSLRLEGVLRAFADVPSWRARLELAQTRAEAWFADAPRLSLSAGLELEGGFERVAVAGGFELGEVPGGPYRGRVDLGADAGAVRFERLELRPVNRDSARATLAGEVGFADDGPRFDLDLAWDDLQWPLEGDADVTSPGGRLALVGTTDDYRLEGEAEVQPLGMGPDAPLSLRLDAGGDTLGLDRLAATIDWMGARLALEGGLRWAAPGSTRLRAELRDFDPARFGGGLPGRIEADLRAEADWDGDGARGQLTLERLAGELDGHPVTGDARVAYADDTLTLGRLRLAAGQATFEADGRLGEDLAFAWSLDIADLGTLTDAGAGRLSGQGRLGGQPDTPEMVGRLEGEGLAWAGARVDRLSLRADAGLAPERASSLALSLQRLTLGGETIDRLGAELTGTPAAHTLEVDAGGARGTLDLALRGGLEGTDWRGSLERLGVEPAGRPRWTLADPAGLVWSDGRGRLERACLREASARICLQGAGDAADWSASLEADALPLSLPGAFGPPQLRWAGTLNLRAGFSGGTGPVTGEARIDLGGGHVRGPIEDEEETLLAWEPGHLEAGLGAERITARFELPLADGGRIDGTAGFDRSDGTALEGRLQGRVDDLGLVASLVPAIGRVEGALVADVGVSGALADPRLNGGAELEQGRVTVIPLGLEVRELRLGLETVQRGFRLRLAGRSGEGDLQGLIDLRRAEEGRWVGEGKIAGQDFEAMAVPELALTVSPDLSWRVDGREIHVDGRVAIPRARIAPRDLEGTVQPSPDAVIVDAEGEPTEPDDWQVLADVTVVPGDDVHIDAFGLEGRLEGELRLRERPGRLTTGNGELRVVEGSYTIYRQTLEIERGRVLFDGGPVSDPGLDVRAVRRPRDVVVGVNVRGTLRDPRANLFSEPSMPESQQLSYLIAGVPMGESSDGDRNAMGAVAGALATTEQGRELAGRLGIQQVEVDRSQGEGASLVLGRYLSPRLYVGYGIGLAEQANSVRVRYDLTRQWSVEARSGGNASADLLYSIETDADIAP